MKKKFFLFSLLCLFLISIIPSCKSIPARSGAEKFVIAQIDSLIEQKNFFSARDLYKRHYRDMSIFDQLKTGVFLDHAFNKSDSSAHKAEMLFSLYEDRLNDSLKYKIEALAHINYSRDFLYKDAKESLKNLLAGYVRFMKEDEKENYQNTLLIWEALQDQPKQFVDKKDSLNMPIIRDKAGLQNIQISSGKAIKNFIFDTGANISTITESTAEEFGVKELPGSFEVDAVTGNKIQSRIGIAPQLELGSITIHNAIFLILPDEALAFPQIDYQINGILGFPVLEAMDEIQITRDDRFIVPVNQSNSKEKNLALDFLTPLLYLKTRNSAGVYTFDTGANKTMLYNNFLQQNRQEFNGTEPELDYTFGGAGGAITKKGIYTTFTPEINGKIIEIDSVIVLKEPITSKNFFFGNLGQDLINKFEKMIINFDRMFIRFE